MRDCIEGFRKVKYDDVSLIPVVYRLREVINGLNQLCIARVSCSETVLVVDEDVVFVEMSHYGRMYNMLKHLTRYTGETLVDSWREQFYHLSYIQQ